MPLEFVGAHLRPAGARARAYHYEDADGDRAASCAPIRRPGWQWTPLAAGQYCCGARLGGADD